jgi:hypothetical protein
MKNPACAAVKREERKIGAMTGVLLRRVKSARPGAQHDDDYDVIDGDGLVI